MKEGPTQPVRNVPGIFAECSLNVAVFRTYKEHLLNISKENIFNKFSIEKLFLC